jgi:hypothetical protein
MGSVVRAVATVGVALAVAVAAPYLGGVALSVLSIGGSAVALSAATAVAGLALSLAAGLVMQAFIPKPTSADLGWSHADNTMWMGPFGFVQHPDPPVAVMPAKRAHWLRDPCFLPGQRFALQDTRGTCMNKAIPEKWCILDRDAEIRRGDYFHFNVDDLSHYMHVGTIRACLTARAWPSGSLASIQCSASLCTSSPIRRGVAPTA